MLSNQSSRNFLGHRRRKITHHHRQEIQVLAGLKRIQVAGRWEMPTATIARRSPLLKLTVCFLLVFGNTFLSKASQPQQLKTATSHPIQYYLSQPEGWTAAKK